MLAHGMSFVRHPTLIDWYHHSPDYTYVCQMVPYMQAVEHAKTSIRRQPNVPEMKYQLGVVHTRMDQCQQASLHVCKYGTVCKYASIDSVCST